MNNAVVAARALEQLRANWHKADSAASKNRCP
jgi:hypothetical protein